MLEDKWAQRILAPQDAPTVGMCRFLPFLSPVTQTRFTSQPSAGASPGTGGLSWRGARLVCCSWALWQRRKAKPSWSRPCRHAVTGSGTAWRAQEQGRDCFVTGSACRAAGEALVEPRSEAAPLTRRSSSWCLFTGLGGVCGQAWSTQVSGWQPGRCLTSFFPLLEHLESWAEPPSAGRRGAGPARCSVSLAVGARRLCVRRGTHRRAKPHLNCFGFEPRDAQMCRLFQM